MMVRRSFLIICGTIVFILAIAIAFFFQDQQEDAAFQKRQQAGLEWYEQSVALVVGVGNYSMNRPPHPYAVANAEKVAQELERQGFIVHKLIDAHARKEDIEHMLHEVIAPSLGPRDRFLFYFSGYAVTRDNGMGKEFGYLVPIEGTYEWPHRLNRFVSLKRLRRFFRKKIVARHSLIVIDHCLTDSLAYEMKDDERVCNLGRLMGRRNIRILTPGYDCERSAGPHFTDAFLSAISGEADHGGDGYVDFTELATFVKATVLRESKGCQRPVSASWASSGGMIFRYDRAALLTRMENPAPPVEKEFLPIPLVRIEPGTFLMGVQDNHYASEDALKKLHVEVKKPFLIGKTEVTQGQWRAVMGDNPSHFQCCGDDCPVENVSWFDAVVFCNRLSQLENLRPCYRVTENDVQWEYACTGYRLPTDEEWEYAARAGTDAATPVGEYILDENFRQDYSRNLYEFAWYDGNSQRQTQRVAHRNPNAWNLYDVLGNVSEYVWNCHYHNIDAQGKHHDVGGIAQCRHRCSRGCDYLRDGSLIDIGERMKVEWRERDQTSGFRLARSIAGAPDFDYRLR